MPLSLVSIWRSAECGDVGQLHDKKLCFLGGLIWPNWGPEDIDTNIKAVILCV